MNDRGVMQLEELKTMRGLWEREHSLFKNKQHPDNFPALPELAAARYTSEPFYQLEMEYLWKRTWLLAGVDNELPMAGCYKTVKITDIPIVLVRGEDEKIRAFYNVCQHRGVQLCHAEAGRSNRLRCSYHAWSYDLEGRLSFVPSEHEYPGLDKCGKSLKPISVGQLGNLIFISMNPEVPFEEFLGSCGLLVSDVPWSRVHLYRTISHQCDTNWKCMQDAFSESHHVKYVHASTAAQAVESSYMVKMIFKNGHGSMNLKLRDDSSKASIYRQVDSALDDGMKPLTRVSQRSYNIFPNLQIPISSHIFSVMSVWPVSVGQCRIDLSFFKICGEEGFVEDPLDQEAVEQFAPVVGEDLATLAGSYLSLKSGGVKSLRLNYSEQIIYNLHLEIDRVIGKDRVPEALRVTEIDLPRTDD